MMTKFDEIIDPLANATTQKQNVVEREAVGSAAAKIDGSRGLTARRRQLTMLKIFSMHAKFSSSLLNRGFNQL